MCNNQFFNQIFNINILQKKLFYKSESGTGILIPERYRDGIKNVNLSGYQKRI